MEKSAFIRLNPKDNVIVARRDVPAGVRVENEGFTTLTKVPAGYKVAARDIRKGEQILKYNTCIGFAAEDTPAGTMMHSHNIVFEHVDLDYAFSKDYHPTELLPPEQRATFQGFVRPDGRVATRNYIGILVASNCAATGALHHRPGLRHGDDRPLHGSAPPHHHGLRHQSQSGRRYCGGSGL